MSAFSYRQDGHVVVLTMNDDENRFNPAFLEAFLSVLDEIENKTDARTLVVQSAHAKIFCNGIDLQWLVPVFQRQDTAAVADFFVLLNRLYKRILTYPLLTVACINGHAFAGGAILTCAFDFRLMRSDRGYFCLPEIDLGIYILPGMNALLKKMIPFYKLVELELGGIRMTADQCETHHIIVKSVHQDHLLDETIAFAKTLDKQRSVVAEFKQRLYADIVRVFDTEDAACIEAGNYYNGSLTPR